MTQLFWPPMPQSFLVGSIAVTWHDSTGSPEMCDMTQKLRYWVGLSAFGLFLAVEIAVAAGPDARLVDAMAQQNRQAVRELITQGVDVNSRTADGSTALHWAAHWDDVETVEFLLKAGAYIDAADDHGVTPLSLAPKMRACAWSMRC